MMSEVGSDRDSPQALSFTSATISQLEGRLHELAEQDQQDRPRWAQINSRLAELKDEHDALMREKNVLIGEQGTIRVKAQKRTEEYRRTQQAIAALKGARDSHPAIQNGSGTTAAPPHGLPTVTKALNPAIPKTPIRAPLREEIETIIIESDEEEERDSQGALISAGPANRQLLKPVDAIHERFPTVVDFNGQWHEIRCRGCGANIKPGTLTWFKGLRGLRIHYRQSHCPRDSLTPTAEVCCIMRPVSSADIGLMKQGLPPRDVAIEAFYASKMLGESCPKTIQASSNVEPSDREVPRTPTKMSGVHDNRDRDGSQR